MWGSVIPGAVAGGGSTLRILGRERTPYFYRKQAIAWAQHARRGGFGDVAMCIGFAKSYLKTYREMTTPRPAKVCAWCGCDLGGGMLEEGQLQSHGMCPGCLAKMVGSPTPGKIVRLPDRRDADRNTRDACAPREEVAA